MMSNQHRRLVSSCTASSNNHHHYNKVLAPLLSSKNIAMIRSSNNMFATTTNEERTKETKDPMVVKHSSVNNHHKKIKLNTITTTAALHYPPPTSVVEEDDETSYDCHNNNNNNINVQQEQKDQAEAPFTNMSLVMEHIDVLKKRQTRYQPCINLFEQQDVPEIQMYRQRRQILCDWVIRVVHYFHLPTTTIVAHAMNLIDRFVAVYHKDLILKHSSSSSDDQNKLLESSNCSALKLITTTALFIALKLYQGNSDGMRGHANLTSIVPFMSNGEFSLQKVEQFEMILIKTLGFFVSNPPLPIHFVAEYLNVLQSIIPSSFCNSNILRDQDHRKLIMEYSDMFCQMVIRDDHDEDMMVISNKYKPSIIGLACLFNGMKLAGLFWKQQDCNSTERMSHNDAAVEQEHDSLMRQLLSFSDYGAPPLSCSSDKKRKRAHCCSQAQDEEDMVHVKQLQQILWTSYLVRQRQKQQATQQHQGVAAASSSLKKEDQGRHVSISPTSVVESVEGQQQQQLRPRPPAA